MRTTDDDLHRLRQRVDRLERAVVQAVGAAACLALVVGSLLAYTPAEEGEDDVTPRLLTAGFTALTYRDADGGTDGFTVSVGIGFLGLMVVAALMVLLVVDLCSQAPSLADGRVMTVVLTLLVIGTVIATLFWLVLAGSEDFSGGWGMVVFAVGVVLCLVLTRSGLRWWWDPALQD